MIAVLNEAELRGIDLSALQEELFTSRSHLAMMARHEIKLRMIYGEVHRPPLKNKTSVNPGSRVDRVDVVPQFTKKQIEIAQSVLEKR